MNGLKHFIATSSGTLSLKPLWERVILLFIWSNQELLSLERISIYPLHLTEVLASLDFYSMGVATHHTCALGLIAARNQN